MAKIKVLFFLRFTLTLISFLFIVQQFSIFSWLHWFSSNLFFYTTLLILASLTLWITWREHNDFTAAFRSLLVSFLSTALLFLIGYTFSREFHYFIPFSIGLYVISTLAFFAYQCAQRERDAVSTQSTHTTLFTPFLWHKSNRFDPLFVIIFTLAFFLFGLHGLTRFAAVDEPLWLDGRIGNFWKSLSEQRMDKTLISDKPGITVVIASGPGLLFVEPKYYRDTRNDFEAKHPGINIEDLYLAFRLPLLVVITLLLPLFYLFLVPLVGTSTALFGYSAIALSPILIGISKIVNPDSLLWIFAPLSFLAYLAFLEKRSWRFLLFSGILFGLALLTKYVANFLVVYLFVLSFLYPLWKQDGSLSLSFLFKIFLIWFGIGISVLYLFIPAFWIHPTTILSSTIFSQAFEKVAWIFMVIMSLVFIDQFLGKSYISHLFIKTITPFSKIFVRILLGFFVFALSFTLLNGIFGMPWIHSNELLASPKTSSLQGLVHVFFTNFYPLIFGVAPLILFGMSVVLWKVWRTPLHAFTSSERLSLAIVLFILLYYLGSLVNGVVLINRYQIMLYPLLALLGGIGLLLFIKDFWKSVHHSSFTHQLSFVFLTMISGLLALSPFLTPFPFSYASTLLPKQYSVDVKDMGSGSYEAAMYLNSLPHAKGTAIWTDKTGVCKFYVGPCLDGFNISRIKKHDIRYLVLSSGRAPRTQRRFDIDGPLYSVEDTFRFDTYYERNNPLYEIKINGRTSQNIKIFTLDQ